jgi:hypothetical protein
LQNSGLRVAAILASERENTSPEVQKAA